MLAKSKIRCSLKLDPPRSGYFDGFRSLESGHSRFANLEHWLICSSLEELDLVALAGSDACHCLLRVVSLKDGCSIP